jgi:hypothetical protein
MKKTERSKMMKEKWKNGVYDSDEYRKKLSNNLKEKWKNGVYDSDEYRKKLSNSAKKWIEEKGHPRGMLGKTHNERVKKIISNMCKKRIGDKHPYWKGGTQTYWNRVARKVMKDTPNKCFYCDNESVIVHHIDEDISNNKRDNLLKVCHSCHRKVCHKKRTLEIIKKMNRIRKMKMIRRKKNEKFL